MKTINIQHPVKQLALKSFQQQKPKRADVQEIISEDACIVINGEIVAIYQKVDYDLTKIRTACTSLKFQDYIRQSGLSTKTVSVNASPRNRLRMNKCSLTALRRALPITHNIFLDYARKIARDYRVNFGTAYANQIKHSYIGRNRVHEAYIISRTPFTSAVINKNTALGYHRDTANTKDGISCMLILKKGVGGGELILPELNIGFACEDGYILLFDGQKYIHGVTPILKPQTGNGYRYTIVYYNNKGMSLCLAPREEEKFYREYLEKKTESRYQKQLSK
jgi:hypothetical protein